MIRDILDTYILDLRASRYEKELVKNRNKKKLSFEHKANILFFIILS